MGPKRVKTLLSSFESADLIARSDHKLIHDKTGIPEKIVKEIIIKAKKITH